MNAIRKTLLNRVLCAIGRLFFRWRNALFPIVFAITAFVIKPGFYTGNRRVEALITLAGIALALLGGTIRCLTVGFADIIRGGKDGHVHATDLVRRGIYAHTRNPLYFGNLLITFGFSIMYGSVWVCAVVLPFFVIVYLGITAEEERYLAGQFGADYEDYRRTVNRFIPNPRGFRETLRQHRFDWRQAVRKDYGTMFGLLMGMYALNMWKLGLHYGMDALRQRAVPIAIPAVILVAAYGVARFLKKTKRLESVQPEKTA